MSPDCRGLYPAILPGLQFQGPRANTRVAQVAEILPVLHRLLLHTIYVAVFPPGHSALRPTKLFTAFKLSNFPNIGSLPYTKSGTFDQSDSTYIPEHTAFPLPDF